MPVFTIIYLTIIAALWWGSRPPYSQGLALIGGGLVVVTGFLYAKEAGYVFNTVFLATHAIIWLSIAGLVCRDGSRLTVIASLLLVAAGLSVLPLEFTGEEYRTYENAAQRAGDIAGVAAVFVLGTPFIRRAVRRFVDLGRNLRRRAFARGGPAQARIKAQ